MKAKDLMTPSPRSLTPEATARQAAQLMKEVDAGVIPIVAGERDPRLVGLVTDRDLALRVLGEGRDGNTRVSEAMTREIAGVGPDDDVKDVRRLMADRKVRRVPVCDPQGRCLGIISQADLALGEDVSDKAVGRLVGAVSEPTQRPH